MGRLFIWPVCISLIAIIVGVVFSGQSVGYALYLLITLILLEVALSADNAVVNARVLRQLPSAWQQVFLWVGLPFAVIGMRLLFPLLLVDWTTSLNFNQTLHIALFSPHDYHAALAQGLPILFGFGGSFLLMVGLNFFITDTPDWPWWDKLEQAKWMKALQKKPVISPIVISLIIMGLLAWCLPEIQRWHVVIAFVIGLLSFLALQGLSHTAQHWLKSAGQSGLIGCIYLEVLDASFSLDSVIGAFVIANNIVIIMIGLGIGALFVRVLTIFLIRRHAFTQFRFLEHGAHYAIVFLAIVMLIKIHWPVPEWLPGITSLLLIGLAIFHSQRLNQKQY